MFFFIINTITKKGIALRKVNGMILIHVLKFTNDTGYIFLTRFWFVKILDYSEHNKWKSVHTLLGASARYFYIEKMVPNILLNCQYGWFTIVRSFYPWETMLKRGFIKLLVYSQKSRKTYSLLVICDKHDDDIYFFRVNFEELHCLTKEKKTVLIQSRKILDEWK